MSTTSVLTQTESRTASTQSSVTSVQRPRNPSRTSSSFILGSTSRPSSSSSATLQAQQAQEQDSCSNSKDALCRRMGAMFLRHRVEQLADDVDKLSQQQQQPQQHNRRPQKSNAHCPVQRHFHNRQQRKAYALEKSSPHHHPNPFDRTTTVGDDQRNNDQDKCAKFKRGLARRICRSTSPAPASIAAAEQSQTESEIDISKHLSFTTAKSAHSPALVPPTSATRTTAKRIVVADSSLLIYSLRTVHQWLKAGDCRVVVPCEALSTLDVLKKGDEILNFAARRATRFLDEQFRAIEDDDERCGYGADTLPAEQQKSPAAAKFHEHKQEFGIGCKPGLYPQGGNHRFDFASNNDKELLREAGVEVDILAHAPLHVQRTLSCVLHFLARLLDADQRQGADDDESASGKNGGDLQTTAERTAERQSHLRASCSLAISLPPPHLDFEQQANEQHQGCSGGTLTSTTKNSMQYATRADGNVLLHWANVCGLASATTTLDQQRCLIVAPTAASWLTANVDSCRRTSVRD